MMKPAGQKIAAIHNMLSLTFSILLLVGILVCSICDVAISGAFTWSLYPISSILFAWFVFMPLIKYGSKGALGSLTAFSILIIPFLYVLSKIVDNSLIMTVGIRMSLFSIAYLWCVYLIFRRLKARKRIAAAVSLLLAIPLYIIISASLVGLLFVSFLDIWDVLPLAGIAISAAALFTIDHFKIHRTPCRKQNG